ncbi:MAG: low molecular weight phosphotyrosine protein phosphatase [Bacteroidales bacterium]|nr:low molecular weight phosphotyrosine protein phosphatase [Bacteroidales bacterium]
METKKLVVLFVCHGNICRSPMAEYIFRRMVERAGLSECISVSSAATSREEIGNPVYPLAKRMLATHGIGCRDKVAQQMTRQMYLDSDYVIVMDTENIGGVEKILRHHADSRLHRLLDFVYDADGTPLSRDVADPWYTRDFETAWSDIELGCNALLDHLKGIVGQHQNDNENK